MRRALALAVLLLPAALRPLSASQVEGTPGFERMTPILPGTQPILSAALGAPIDLTLGALPVAPLDVSGEPPISSRKATTSRAESAAYERIHTMGAHSMYAAAAEKATESSPSPVGNSIETAQGEAPAIAAHQALENARPLAREILGPMGERRPAEFDSQAASAIFGEAKRPEGAARDVAGADGSSVSRLESSRPTLAPRAQPPAPAKAKGSLTRKLIWANIVTFALTVPAMPASAIIFGVLPPSFRHALAIGSPVGIGYGIFTMFSYMFVHANLSHIFNNMLVFWLFGRGVEERFGRRGLWRIYLLSGVTAAAASLVLPISGPIIGASAAIFGVLTAWLAIERKEGADAPSAREAKLLGYLGLLNALGPLVSAFFELMVKGSMTFSLLQIAGMAVGWMMVGRALGRERNPLGAKALFAYWMIAQNVLILLLGGQSYNGTYVLGHVIGGAVGALLAYKVFLKKPTNRVA